MTEIIVATITGGLALVGVIISNVFAAKKTSQSIAVSQAVTDTKIDELTREVREHNNFASRIPTVENEVKNIKKDIQRLESFHMGRAD